MASLSPQNSIPIERLIAAALALDNITEQGAQNHGQTVEWLLHEVGLPPGDPWCAAYVSHVGYWSQYNPITHQSHWPLPRTGACAVLGDFAATHAMLQATPQRGDIFLLYVPTLGRFAHTGIILDVCETPTTYLCTTIEGNTTDDGSRDGWKSCIKQRPFPKASQHRFIRWEPLT
jgi:hypothetical protein